MISVRHKGSFKNSERFFTKARKLDPASILAKYGEMGVEALKSATPSNSGVTADSWSYQIESGNGSYTLSFSNSSENDGANIVILLMYGHGTGTGGYVQANDFVNPALEPVFQQIASEAWKEVSE